MRAAVPGRNRNGLFPRAQNCRCAWWPYHGLLIAKKNSKSTTAAGIGITFLLRNWRHSAEALILAPTIEVAGNSSSRPGNMIKASEELGEYLHVQDHIRTITHKHTGATLKVVAADNETVSGKKASLVIIDEFWLFGKREEYYVPCVALMHRSTAVGPFGMKRKHGPAVGRSTPPSASGGSNSA